MSKQKLARTKELQNDSLYYDGSCPLCRKEMNRLSKYQERIELIDIHQLEDFSSFPEKQTLLKRLHLKTAEGKWVTGIDANIRAWKHTPYSWLWFPLTFPIVHFFASKVYNQWALWRFDRLYK